MNPIAQPSGRRESLIAALFATLVAALPLLSYPLTLLPHAWVAERFQLRFPWPELAAAILVVALVRERRRPLGFGRHGQPLALAMLGLLFVQTLSALLSDSPGGYLPWMLRYISWLLLTLAGAQFLEPVALKRLAAVWTIASAVEAVILLWQAIQGVEPVGTIGNRNFAAGYLALSLPVGVAWLARRAQQHPAYSPHWLRSWLLAANYAGLLLAGIGLAHSRGAALGLLVVCGLWALGRLRRPMRWLACGLTALALLGLASSPAVARSARTLWRTDVRPAIWRGTLRMIADAPWLGHGPGSFVRAYPAYRPPDYFQRPKATTVTDHAHNEFLEVTAENGLIGLVIFLAVLGVSARAARTAIASAPDPVLRMLAVGVTLGLGALVLQNLVDINLRMPPNRTLFWIGLGWLGAAMGTACADRRQEMDLRVRRFTQLAGWAVAVFIFTLGVLRPLATDWFYRQGLLAQSAGNLQRALAAFERTTTLDPDRIEAWRQLGLVAHKLGQRQLAVQAFRLAWQEAPDYANLNGELGSLLAMQGDYRQAVGLFTRATQLYPADATNFAKLAKVWLALHQPEKARAALETAVRLDPQNPLVRAVAAEFGLRPPH